MWLRTIFAARARWMAIKLTCFGQCSANVLFKCHKNILPFFLSLNVCKVSQKTLLESCCVYSSIQFYSKLLHSWHIKLCQITKFEYWCIVFIRVACFFNVYTTSSAKAILDITSFSPVLLSPLAFAFLARLYNPTKHFVWYLASRATISPVLSFASSSVSSRISAQVFTRLSTWNVAASWRPLVPGGCPQKKHKYFATYCTCVGWWPQDPHYLSSRLSSTWYCCIWACMIGGTGLC